MGFIIKRRYEYLLAYLIPLVVLLAAFAVDGVYPFGSTSVLLWDMKIQYVGYFGWLSEVLNGQADLFYSSAKGLGGGMIALFAYYLSSPFNLLAAFFDTAHTAELMSWLELIKIPAAGVTCYVFLRKRHGGGGTVDLLLACSYALCGYALYNASNIMWLDGVIMLPLVALGVSRAVRKSSYTLLFVTVACAILFNWYTAYIDCLAAILFFAFEELHVHDFRLKGRIRMMLRSAGGFVTTMLLAVLASMFLFLPTIFGLQEGKGGTLSISDLFTFKITLNPCDFFSFFCITTGPTSSESTVPAVYLSAFALLLAVVFLINRRIDKRLRIAVFVMLALVGAAFFIQPLEIVWSGLKKSTSYYYRFAYVFVFILVVCAARGRRSLETLARRDQRGLIARALTLTGVVLLLSIANVTLYNKDVAPSKVAIIVQVVLLVVFAVLIYLVVRCKAPDPDGSPWPKRLRRAALVVALVVFIAEQSYNASSAFSDYRFSVSQYDDYMSEMDTVYSGLSTDEGFVRVGQSKFSYLSSSNQSTTAESLVLGASGLNHYSSTMEASTETFVCALGYSKYSIFGTYYNASNVVSDSLLGLRYIISDVAPFGATAVSSETLPYVDEQVYENDYALPLGYGISDTDGSIDWTDDPLANQESLVSAMTGTDASDLYVEPTITDVSSSQDATRTWTLTVQTSGPLYIYTAYLDDNWLQTNISVDGTFVQTVGGRFNNNLVYLGPYEQGDTVTLTFTLKDPSSTLSSGQTEAEYLQQSATADIFTIGSLNVSRFEEALGDLDSSGFELQSYEDGYVEATFTASTDETLLLTVPYDAGWTAWVDGQEVSIKQFYSGCSGISVSAGTHEVVLRYTAPGLYAGIALSFVGIVGFGAWRLLARRRRRLACSGTTGSEHTEDKMKDA
jgi:uncharacterized membrane protein YfhO